LTNQNTEPSSNSSSEL